MNVRTFVLATALAVASTTAFAAHCPMDMRKIDTALSSNPKLSADQLAQVKQLREEGEALHKAGKHQESVEALGKAMAILGVS